MDQQRLVKFKLQIQSRIHELTRNPETLRTSPQDCGPDEGDRATSALSTDLFFAQNSQNRQLVNAMREALGRIEEGTFGECMNCGQEINLRRMEAVPWARCCVNCQELIEGMR